MTQRATHPECRGYVRVTWITAGVGHELKMPRQYQTPLEELQILGMCNDVSAFRQMPLRIETRCAECPHSKLKPSNNRYDRLECTNFVRDLSVKTWRAFLKQFAV